MPTYYKHAPQKIVTKKDANQAVWFLRFQCSPIDAYSGALLRFAIIEQAFKDLFGEQGRYRKSALHYLQNSVEFEIDASAAGLDPAWVRKLIRKWLEPPQLSDNSPTNVA
jgi:hypothetical protein